MFYLLTLLVVASRLLPHPPNVACMGALGLFAGCYLSGKRAFLIPLAALLISDVVGHVFGVAGMGFYNPVTMAMVYLATVLAVPVGRCLKNRRSPLRVAAGSLAVSTLFFLVSNLGVWLGGWYPMNAAGLLACYVYAIPFFGYTIAGDLAYTSVLFGSEALSRQLGGREPLAGGRRLTPAVESVRV